MQSSFFLEKSPKNNKRGNQSDDYARDPKRDKKRKVDYSKQREQKRAEYS
jgi:hypothetical protein